MKLYLGFVVLSIFGCILAEASFRWKRDGEILTENQETQTEISISQSMYNDSTPNNTDNNNQQGQPTTSHRPTTTRRSTASRTTRPSTSRTTRSTTKRTTTTHTTRHYGLTTPSTINISSEFDIVGNTTMNTDIGEKESSTMKTLQATQKHTTAMGRQTNNLKNNATTDHGGHPTRMPITKNDTTGDVMYDYDYVDTTGPSVNNTPMFKENTDKINVDPNIVPGSTSNISKPSKNLLELAKELELSIFLEYINQAGMDKTLEGSGPFTIFAPSNKAFDALPYFVSNSYIGNSERLKEILEYHVVKGALLTSELNNDQTIPTLRAQKDIRINIYPILEKRKLITATGAHISYANYRATNGIIHVIEKVLYRIPEANVIDALSKSSKFKALSEAIEKTSLKTRLQEGPFTFFAPTQFAFQKMSDEDRNRLLNDKDALENILKLHVVPGTFYLSSLKQGTELTTIENQILKVSYMAALIRVNNATILEADIPVTNGVIHSVNTLFFPSISKDSSHTNMLMQH